MKVQLLTKISLIFFLYVLVSYFYAGITTRPTEGDSLAYHIPIAKSIVNGSFLHPKYTNDHEYFPGSFEVLLAGFILLHIPLNIYNVLAIIVLFFAAKYLGSVFGLKQDYATIFAVTICTLNTILRWATSQTVDIWLGVFFLLALALFKKPQKSLWYFLLLGISLGMLIGTKYSGPVFAALLFVLFIKSFLGNLNLRRFIVFILPVAVLGIFWYIRNYYAIGNPFYPFDTPFFKGIKGNPILQFPIWKAILTNPVSMLNAFFGEYMLWAITVFLVPVVYAYSVCKKQHVDQIKHLLILSVCNLVVFLLLPSDTSYQIHVSQFRFAYPVFIPLILCAFILAKEYKKEEALTFLSLGNMFTVPTLGYHPKLLFFYLPVVFFFVFSGKLRGGPIRIRT